MFQIYLPVKIDLKRIWTVTQTFCHFQWLTICAENTLPADAGRKSFQYSESTSWLLVIHYDSSPKQGWVSHPMVYRSGWWACLFTWDGKACLYLKEVFLKEKCNIWMRICATNKQCKQCTNCICYQLSWFYRQSRADKPGMILPRFDAFQLSLVPRQAERDMHDVWVHRYGRSSSQSFAPPEWERQRTTFAASV